MAHTSRNESTAYLVTYWDGRRMRVATGAGQVLVFRSGELAERFVERLGEYRIDAAVSLPRTPLDLMNCLVARYGEQTAEQHFIVVEAQTTGPQDALQWTRELADRVAATVLVST